MQRAIIDTTVWLGYFWERDQWRIPGTHIIEAFLEGKIQKVYVTDYIIVETINFLLRKKGHEAAKTALRIFQDDRITIYYVDALFFKEIEKLFESYPGLSIPDISLVVLGKRENINTMFSFDGVFDKVKGIERLEDYQETEG